MYKDELNDLEKVYTDTLDLIEQELETFVPAFLRNMEHFLKLQKKKEAISEKLDVLLAKTSSQSQDEADGTDDE